MAKLKNKIKDLFHKPEEAVKEQEVKKEEQLGVQFALSDAKQTEIVTYIKQCVDEYSLQRSGYMARQAAYIRQYEGVKEPKTMPWPGCSNVSTMVTTVACDLLHSKLFPMCWNAKSLTWEGIEEHDTEVAEINKQVMSWVVSTDMGMQDLTDDLTHRLIVEGTVAAKKIWKPYWVHVTRKIPKEISPDQLLRGKLEYDIQYDYIRRERCFVELRDLEYVFFPYDADSTEMRWEDNFNIIDERWYTVAELRELQLDGAISDEVNLDNLAAKLAEPEEIRGAKKARLDAEGTKPHVTLPEHRKIKCYEAEILYDIDGDGRREKCVFFIVDEPEMYLGGKALHAVSRIGRSSWLIRPFLRRPGRALGKGVPELVYNLHNLEDAIHNQRIDAGNMAIAPYFFYRAASGVTPRRIVAGPATGIPLDDPDRDVRFPQFPSSGLQYSFQEEQIVLELIERLTYLTPAMMGKETAERPTARGTLAVIAQGESKFGLLGLRVQHIFCQLLTDIRQKYEENMPPESWARILGRQGVREWPSPEAMAGMYEAKMQLDLTASDPGQDRQLAIMMFQSMAMDPLVMQNPAFMWEVRADYLKAIKREPVEKYIGPKPEMESTWKDVEDIIAMIEQEFTAEGMDLESVDPATILPKLMEFQKTSRFAQMTEEAKRVLTEVIRELKMMYVEKMREGVMANAQGGGQTAGSGSEGGKGGTGLGGLAPAGVRSMGAGVPGGATPGAARRGAEAERFGGQ